MHLSQSVKLPLTWGLTTLSIGLLLTLLAAIEVTRENRLITQKKLVDETERLAFETSESIRLYEYGLRGARGYILGIGNQLSRDNFRQYSLTRNYEKEFPGARGFGFIRRVPLAQENNFLELARADGKPDFNIYQLTPHTNERYVIQYIEPQKTNDIALGLDINSENFRHVAAETAITTGQIQLTAPITLVQTKDHIQQSFLILLAVYASWETPATEKERWEQAIGWTFAPLSMQDILNTLNVNKDFYQLNINDIGKPQTPIEIYKSENIELNSSLHSYRVTRIIYGRTWQFNLSAKPKLLTALSPIKMAKLYAFGCLISFVLGLFAAILGSIRYANQKIAAQQSSLAAIVESTHDGIIGKTLEGVVTSWNKGAEEIFGFTAREAIGKKIIDLIVPTQLQLEEMEILVKLKRGEEISQFVTKRKTKEEKLIDVLVNVSPIFDGKGTVVSASKTVRDITNMVATEREIVLLNSQLEARVNQRTQELNDAKQNLQTLLNAIPSVISYWSSHFVNQFANQAHQNRFGYTLEQIQDLNFNQLIGFDLFTLLLPKIELALNGISQTIEHAAIVNNRQCHFLIQLIPNKNQGLIQGFYFIEHDITEQIEAREKLAKALREQQALLNTVNAQFLYSVTNADGTILEVNDLFCKATGYTRKELIGNNHRIINSGKHTRNFWQEMWIKVKQGHAWRAEVCNRTQSGQFRWFDSVIAPILDIDGKAEKYIALRSDITERRLAEEHRNHLNQLIENILYAATEVSIITTDLEGKITLFNRGSERMLGYSTIEMVGIQTPAILHSPDEVTARCIELTHQFGYPIEGFEVFIHKAKLGQPETRRWTYIKKDGTHILVSLSVSALRDTQGNLFGYLGIADDITDQNKLEQELRTEKENAEAANLAKSQFLANMSHEIRTPMNAVLGMLQLVQQTELTETQKEYIFKTRSAATSLLGILNDILDFSKIEAGKLSFDTHPFSLIDVFDNLGIILSGNQGGKHIELLFDLPADLPKEIVADRLRLQQILVNLAGNALKFTEKGFVKVKLQRLNQSDSELIIRISVEDSGIGISKENQQKIFSGFTQAEASTTRRYGGSGLGLVICKRLLDLMDSELHLESEPGKGSLFWFDLRLAISDNSASIQSSFKDDLKILLVDDNPLVVDILQSSLQSLPWKIDTAIGGASAMKKIQEAEANNCAYDVVVLDWQMPDIDGISLSNQIYQTNNVKKTHLIIMITAFERELLNQVGHDKKQHIAEILVKPVTPGQIVNIIESSLFGINKNKSFSQQAQNLSLQSLNLLVVEDNALNREVAFELLSSVGAKVDLAEGGLEGVKKVTQSEKRYDLVIMDLQMPDIDGFEATRRIRMDGRFNTLPILAMTANASEADRKACLDVGMNDHTGKPFDLAKLIPLIIQLTNKILTVPSNTNQTTSSSPTLMEDLKSLLNRYAGNFDLFKRFQKKFKPDIEKLLITLNIAINDNNMAAATSALHSIKGLAATLGAVTLSRCASDLEKSSKQQLMPSLQDIEKLTQLLIDSDREMEKMANPIEELPAETKLSENSTKAELVSKLNLIAEYLKASNMDAVNLLEQIQDQLPNNSIKTELVNNINNLEFSKAYSCLYKIIEEL